MTQCPCGSQIDYIECCEPYLTDKKIPQTPESLMRSRYTAYSQANVEYIKKTMRGKPLIGFNAQQTKEWAEHVQWLELKVVSASTSQDIGLVEFVAKYSEKGSVKTIHEVSKFENTNGSWFYTDGVHPKKNKPARVSRNSPCPCGSGRKFKNCHDKT